MQSNIRIWKEITRFEKFLLWRKYTVAILCENFKFCNSILDFPPRLQCIVKSKLYKLVSIDVSHIEKKIKIEIAAGKRCQVLLSSNRPIMSEKDHFQVYFNLSFIYLIFSYIYYWIDRNYEIQKSTIYILCS